MTLNFLIEDMHTRRMHTEELDVFAFYSAETLAVKIASFPKHWHIINVWLVLS